MNLYNSDFYSKLFFYFFFVQFLIRHEIYFASKILQWVFVCRVAGMHCCIYTTSYELHLLCTQNCHFFIETDKREKQTVKRKRMCIFLRSLRCLVYIKIRTYVSQERRKPKQKNQCNTNMCIKASAVYLASCISRISYLLKSLILSLSVAQLCTANACSVLSFALCSRAAFCGHHAFAASKQMNWKTSRIMNSGIFYSSALHLSHPTDSLPVECNI